MNGKAKAGSHAEGADPRQLIDRIRHAEMQLLSLRHQIVKAHGVANALTGSTGNNPSLPGFVAVEIQDGSGTAIDAPNVHPTQSTVRVENQSGELAVICQGQYGPGVVQITIPDQEARGIARVPGKTLSKQLVQYEYFDPCYPIALPGVICITQLERYVVQSSTDGDGSSGDAQSTNLMVITKDGSGGFSLTNG